MPSIAMPITSKLESAIRPSASVTAMRFDAAGYETRASSKNSMPILPLGIQFGASRSMGSCSRALMPSQFRCARARKLICVACRSRVGRPTKPTNEIIVPIVNKSHPFCVGLINETASWREIRQRLEKDATATGRTRHRPAQMFDAMAAKRPVAATIATRKPTTILPHERRRMRASNPYPSGHLSF